MRHSGNRCRARILLGHIYKQDGEEEKRGEPRGGVERANLAVRSKEWRTSQITRLLCDIQPSLEFFLLPWDKENLLVDEERFLLNVKARRIVLKIEFVAEFRLV